MNVPSDDIRPWNSWELDRPFIESLDTYTNDHGESKFKTVVIKIIAVIEGGNDLAGAIPNIGPVPVALVVKGVIQVILLVKVCSH